MTAKEYWDSLNEMYGLNLEMPKGLDEPLNTAEIEFDIAMGRTFDGATQREMEEN